MKKTTKPVVIPKINLVPRDPFYDTFVGKAMVWGTQVGRYLIVFTEIIVIISFASRFKLDRDLTDLTASITQKKAIVESYGTTETRVKSLQKRIEQVTAVLATGTTDVYFDALTANIPSDVHLSLVSFNTNEIIFAGTTLSSQSLARMIAAFQNDATFKGLSIDKISSGDSKDPSIQFSFRVSIKDKQEAPKVAPAAPKNEAPAI